MNPTKSIRIRYVIGLSALAILIVGTHLLLVREASRQQESYATLINMAGNQAGLSNRIAHFVGQMVLAETPDDFQVARQQVGRAIDLMRKRHDTLLHGDPEAGIPMVRTDLLELIYFDPSFGMDTAVDRFLERARDAYDTPRPHLGVNSASVIFVTNYGPHVLETLLNATVAEHERHSRAELKDLQFYQEIAVISALALLLIEAFLIFRPLERKVRDGFEAIEAKSRETEMALAHAEEASRSKSDFLSSMSHELRTPLNAILGFSEALTLGTYGALNARQRGRLQDMHRAAGYLLSLVNDILLLGASEAGRLDLEESTVESDHLVDMAVAVVEPLAWEAGLEIERDDALDPGPALHVDGRRIQQVLVNLLNNAVKYTPRGGRVRVGVTRTDPGEALFVVEDTGVGMTAEELGRVRDKFERGDATFIRHREGSGLGIPVAIELAAAHGGRVEFDSEKNIGTKVSVTIPADRVLPVAEPVA